MIEASATRIRRASGGSLFWGFSTEALVDWPKSVA
jgi:hypothetical protein